ncbi:MAG: flagellar FlbD family protein [Armatimonadota bacterium]
MIELSLINGTSIVLNSDLIEFLEATPDTVVSLCNGRKYVVRESVAEVVDRIVNFRRRVGCMQRAAVSSYSAEEAA